ncbi:mitochondrial ribosomal protein MRPL25 [Histoplasma ohiense]|nr:mitochondrial ribosomal protein MRPL25 [Histoplasma ohiense (nom. inval.)]
MATKTATSGILENLPVRLRNFFARYPPQIYSANALGAPKVPEGAEALAPAPSPYTPSRSSKAPKVDQSAFSMSQAFLRSDPEHPNPFLPYKNPETGRWRGAMISLRRQNELVKLATKYGVEELLPPSRKSTVYRETKAVEKGLRIRGTGIGQKVKGHKWERTLEGRLEDRKKAMMGMPEMIRLWKQRGHGRGWKKYPRK